MKLKLLIASIAVLLALIAYQQYRDFAVIKSVNSYESCASAKGSIIQESYPATCVTRLGFRFTQPTTDWQTISWEDVEKLILNGEVSSVMESHAREVTIGLKSGEILSSTEPSINDIGDVIYRCGEKCRDILQGSE
jgi:hypothetical protein